ncbi:unnamed protein product [Phaedon cochleariae]|uniref:poly(ADP-ribose) glycohydrolase n=1 Tax=Phaedon cochleariae TaxID=80249 RepID=A0A9P0DRM6_PHACE|nr:unnamed protein product [Phaedon cochleariae]
MALVMLPSDLPWWDSVKRQLKQISECRNSKDLVERMHKIYEMCNVSLEPDEETVDPKQFTRFQNFLDNDLTNAERNVFFSKTLPNMVSRALQLKELRPRGGLHFSLQQQSDCTELQYSFVSSLIANAFFSTFPKRTSRTHPTLQNFNFGEFFKTLNSNVQKSKLKSVLYYFEWLESAENSNGSLRILRQVMSSKEWLTIEDWLECNLPLCHLKIKHDGKLDRSEEDSLQICFASSKIGGDVLENGFAQECINLVTAPELLAVLLNVEALEDNEVLTVENVRHISRITDPKQRALFEKIESPKQITVCCMDAEDYTKLPIGQYEEDNILRELNKCLLGFQQKQTKCNEKGTPQTPHNNRRRLSPIGESIGSTLSDTVNVPMITQQSCSTNRSGSNSPVSENNNTLGQRLCVQLNMDKIMQNRGKTANSDSLVHSRRGRFIVLGSSGECLPISRVPLEDEKSDYSSFSSSENEFHSAKTSLDDGSEDENYHKRYSIDLENPERRNLFAQKLKDVLRKEVTSNTESSSDESSYAVGISVAGSGLEDQDIRVRRGGSTGFALREDSLDENFLDCSLKQEKQWIDKFKSKQSALIRKESNKSSEYSFSTEYSSELEEVYEQFSRWLENPLLETEKGTKRELDTRELAVVRFAGSILKRTLSESFVGIPVPMTENCDSNPGVDTEYCTKKNKLVLNAKSLSLELAKQKHRLAAQLSSDSSTKKNSSPSQAIQQSENFTKKRKFWIASCITEAIVQTLEDISVNVSLPQSLQLSQISSRPDTGPRAVSTGNWGCGTSRKGDVQLKAIVQWLAASVAGIPHLEYRTAGHQQLVKLDTVRRILIDRRWTVKDLAQAALRYSHRVLRGKALSGTLFEELIGADRTM